MVTSPVVHQAAVLAQQGAPTNYDDDSSSTLVQDCFRLLSQTDSHVASPKGDAVTTTTLRVRLAAHFGCDSPKPDVPGSFGHTLELKLFTLSVT